MICEIYRVGAPREKRVCLLLLDFAEEAMETNFQATVV